MRFLVKNTFFSIVLLFFISCQQKEERKFSSIPDTLILPVEQSIKSILKDEDVDGDKKITVSDSTDKQTIVPAVPGPLLISGNYKISILIQELYSAMENGKDTLRLAYSVLLENPVHRISRLIRDNYWSNLTRQIDKSHLHEVIADSKQKGDSIYYLYVSPFDTTGIQYFSELSENNDGIKMVVLPEKISAEYIQSLEGKHGLLDLGLYYKHTEHPTGIPYVVPGGRFNEMYGWDSYFETKGLLLDGRVDLGKAMVDNLIYELKYYGKILNANRTYYLTRSQPPFLTSMIREVYAEMEKNRESKNWLRHALKWAVWEYENVWSDEYHLTDNGLNRYYGMGKGMPPETEPGHYNKIIEPYSKKAGMTIDEYIEKYKKGEISNPSLDSFFVHDRAMRESGHDTSYRWYEEKDQTANYNPVDLNSLLYKYEIDIAFLLEELGAEKQKVKKWKNNSDARQKRIIRYLYNPENGLFYDYNFVTEKQSDFLAATTFYPLWACHEENPETWLINHKKAERLITNGLQKLEAPGGVYASSKESLNDIPEHMPQRQWDYPFGWAPHQMVIWEGLRKYDYNVVADRLIYKWLYMIVKNAKDYQGTIPEKYNLRTRSHKVFAEYGNVGTDFEYITKEGFGWMNASYQVGLHLLSLKKHNDLENLTTPEKLFSAQ